VWGGWGVRVRAWWGARKGGEESVRSMRCVRVQNLGTGQTRHTQNAAGSFRREGRREERGEARPHHHHHVWVSNSTARIAYLFTVLNAAVQMLPFSNHPTPPLVATTPKHPDCSYRRYDFTSPDFIEAIFGCKFSHQFAKKRFFGFLVNAARVFEGRNGVTRPCNRHVPWVTRPRQQGAAKAGYRHLGSLRVDCPTRDGWVKRCERMGWPGC
jgi:hypothetical protein